MSCSLFSNCLGIAPNEYTTNGITWDFFLFFLLILDLAVSRNCKMEGFSNSVFIISYNQSDLQVPITWSALILKSHKTL